MRRLPALLLCFALITACAPKANLPQIKGGLVDAEARKQQEMAVRDYLAKLDQLNRVGWNIRSKNIDLCGENTAFRLGLNVAQEEDYPKDQREIIKNTLGLEARPTLYLIQQGSPAQIAGLQQGDVLLFVDGQEAKNKKQALELLDKASKSGGAVLMIVERAGAQQEFTTTPAKVCSYDVRLKTNPAVNAFADGEHITVMTGMMKFVRSDDELAAILGHEMAHNTQGHIKAKTTNAIIGSFFDILLSAVTHTPNMNSFQGAGAAAFSQDFESEADYVGLYYTARAGYDIEHVADIWRRMAVENPGAITMGNTHPSTSKRFVALEAARDEIKGKMAAGQELKPEMKGK